MKRAQWQEPPLDVLSSVDSPSNNPWTFIFPPVASFSRPFSPESPPAQDRAPLSFHGNSIPSEPNKDLKQRTFIFSGDFWPLNSVRTFHRHNAIVSPDILAAHAFDPAAKGFNFDDRMGAPYYARAYYEHVSKSDSSPVHSAAEGLVDSPPRMTTSLVGTAACERPVPTLPNFSDAQQPSLNGWHGFAGTSPLSTPSDEIEWGMSVHGSYFRMFHLS